MHNNNRILCIVSKHPDSRLEHQPVPALCASFPDSPGMQLTPTLSPMKLKCACVLYRASPSVFQSPRGVCLTQCLGHHPPQPQHAVGLPTCENNPRRHDFRRKSPFYFCSPHPQISQELCLPTFSTRSMEWGSLPAP